MSDPGDRSTLLAELEESRREVDRLRTLLVAKDAELGEARGRVTQLEASSLRLAHLVALPLRLVGRVLHVARTGLSKLRG
jgi:hypothetical protein